MFAAGSIAGPLPGTCLAQSPCLDVGGQYRASRIGQNYLDLRRDAGEESAQAGQRAAGADSAHDGVDGAGCLGPDFRAGRGFVRQWICRVVELIDVPRSRRLARDTFGQVLIILRVSAPNVAARHHHLSAQRLQVTHFLAAHLVGNDQDERISFLRRHQRQSQAGVSGRGLDQRRAGLDSSFALGGFNHRAADAILDRSARIVAFKLYQQPTWAAIQSAQLDQGRATNQIQHVSAA